MRGFRSAVLALVALSSGVVPSGATAQDIGIPIGSEPVPAEVQDLAENPIQFNDLIVEGKPTLVEFWATWCEVCAAIQPELDELQALHGDEVTIIAVAVGVAQTLRRVNRHLEEHDPGYRYVWDVNGAAVRSFQAPVTASIVLLDASGKVAYSGVGEGQNLMARVEALIGG